MTVLKSRNPDEVPTWSCLIKKNKGIYPHTQIRDKFCLFALLRDGIYQKGATEGKETPSGRGKKGELLNSAFHFLHGWKKRLKKKMFQRKAEGFLAFKEHKGRSNASMPGQQNPGSSSSPHSGVVWVNSRHGRGESTKDSREKHNRSQGNRCLQHTSCAPH